LTFPRRRGQNAASKCLFFQDGRTAGLAKCSANSYTGCAKGVLHKSFAFGPACVHQLGTVMQSSRLPLTDVDKQLHALMRYAVLKSMDRLTYLRTYTCEILDTLRKRGSVAK
jgi:hypothetical protein